MELHSRIAAWRKAKGWSQHELARRLGLTAAAICLWERDPAKAKAETPGCSPSRANMDKLLEALRVSMVQFWGPVPKPAKPAKKPTTKRAAA